MKTIPKIFTCRHLFLFRRRRTLAISPNSKSPPLTPPHPTQQAPTPRTPTPADGDYQASLPRALAPHSALLTPTHAAGIVVRSCELPRSPARSRDPPPPTPRATSKGGSTMAPGRKVGASRQQPTEEITDIERERAQTIMRNNQVLRSLGIPTLASIVNSSTTKSKGRAREESDPLYEPEDMEETGDAVLDEDQMDTMMAQPTPEG